MARKKKILKLRKAIDECGPLHLPAWAKKDKYAKAREQLKKINERKRKKDK